MLQQLRMAGRERCSDQVIVCLQTRRSYGWSGASDCRRVRAATTTDTQTRMIADARASCRSYGHSDAYDCRRMCAVVTVEVLL